MTTASTKYLIIFLLLKYVVIRVPCTPNYSNAGSTEASMHVGRYYVPWHYGLELIYASTNHIQQKLLWEHVTSSCYIIYGDKRPQDVTTRRSYST